MIHIDLTDREGATLLVALIKLVDMLRSVKTQRDQEFEKNRAETLEDAEHLLARLRAARKKGKRAI